MVPLSGSLCYNLIYQSTSGGKMMQDLRKNETSESRDLRTILAGRTGTSPDDWFVTFRGREAMQVAFEEISRIYGRGDVIIQPFTCSTVPESVLAGGLDIRYSDISAKYLCIHSCTMLQCFSIAVFQGLWYDRGCIRYVFS